MRLTGKTCLVTGAAQGIGLAIVEVFVREGASVVATDLQLDRLAERFAGTNVATARMDVTDTASLAEVAAAHPAIGVLVNCAGWVANGTILDSDPADLVRSFDINVVSMANTIRAFLPGMRARRHGSIISIASVVSSVMAAPTALPMAPAR